MRTLFRILYPMLRAENLALGARIFTAQMLTKLGEDSRRCEIHGKNG